MVFQRGCAVRISGYATPDFVIEGTFRGHSAKTTVPDSGEWELEFPAGPEGGPFDLTLTTGFASIVLHDVMVGEVWICSGQSNMEYPVGTVGPFWGLPDGEDVMRDGDPGIRIFQTPRITCPDGPCAEPPGILRWMRGDDPEAIRPFSAVAWFFGKALRRRLGADVPIGLVHSSWGGTVIEPWIPRFAYEKAGRTGELSRIDDAIAYREDDKGSFESKYLAAQKPLREWLRDKFFAPNAAASAAALATWAAPTLPPGEDALWTHGKRGCARGLSQVGVTWFRREFTVPASWEGRDVLFHIDKIDDCDEMFLDGVKIGETTIDARQYWLLPRDYTAKLGQPADGRHVLAVRVQNHFNVGSFCDKLTVALDGTDEIIDLSGGEWAERVEFHVDTDKVGVRPDVPSDAYTPRTSPQTPSTLYNSMIAPFTPLALRGAIWYQGCSNRGNPKDYAPLQDLLVASWREAFRNKDLVFLGTQLSAFWSHNPDARLPDDWWCALPPEESRTGFSFVDIREAQERLLNSPGCGLACIIDVGDHSDIHPCRKRPVGERLAQEAMRLAYGDASALPSPRAISATREGSAVRVAFRDAAVGLVSAAGAAVAPETHLFALAGDDGSYAWAEAKIEADGSVVVASPAVSRPVRVEYAWSDFPPEEAQLHRASDGFPLFPFRLEVK